MRQCALRGRRGGTWAHWQLALSYARYLSPAFHAWCNDVVRATMERLGAPPELRGEPLIRYLDHSFALLSRRMDALDRHAADLMFLVTSTQDLLLGRRRDFSERSQSILRAVVASDPFDGQCPCCNERPVLTPAGQPAAGAEFDHFVHRGLNRPEHGWLICRPCHVELTQGGYLARFSRMPEFRAFQSAVVEHRRRKPCTPFPAATAGT